MKLKYRLKLNRPSVNPAGGFGTGSERRIVDTAASSNAGSPDDSATSTDTTLPRRLSTRLTFTLVDLLFSFG